MMNGKFMALALAALAASFAVADEVEYGLVQFVGGPGTVNKHTGFNSPEDWNPQIAPNSEAAATNHYLMANKNSMRTWVSSMTFNGKSLTVGVVGGNSASIQECATAAGIVTTYANDGLIMANGSYWRPSSRNREGTIVGKMKVVSPASAPFTIYCVNGGAEGGHLRFVGPWTAASDAMLKITAGNTNFFVKMVGDLTAYEGTISLRNTGRLLVGSTTMPGTITMAAGTTFGTEFETNSFTVANLSINGDVDWIMPAHATNETAGTVCVTGTFSQTGIATVKLSAIPKAAAGAARVKVPVLSLGPDCTGTLDETKFAFGPPENLAHLDLDPMFELSADGRTVYLSCRPVVLLVKADPDQNDKFDINSDVYTSAMTNALAWSDGRLPHAGAHYLVGTGGAQKCIRFDYVTDMAFAGESLTVGSGGRVHSLNKFTDVKDVYLMPGAYWGNNYAWQLYASNSLKNQNGIRGGRIHTYAGNQTTFSVYFYQYFHFYSELVGDGDLKFVGSGSSAHPEGYIYLDALNTNFTGTIYVTIGNASKTVDGVYYPQWSPSFKHCETLYFRDPRNLGAPLAAFNPKALRLNQMSVLAPLETMTLDDQTRGIHVGNMARFHTTDGTTFTVRSPLAVHGELYKEGLGALELGGALRFGEDGTDTSPTVGSNLFTVASGTFRPLTHDCCDGLSIAFSNNTQMVLAAAPADVGLAQYGLYDVKTDTPFRLLGEGGRIPVTVTVPEGSDAGFYSVPICTVKASAAEAVKDALDLSFPLDGFVAKVRSVPVDAETTTLVATFAYGGTTIIFR